MKVGLNGKILDADAARIDPSDRGLTLGDGLFETIALRKSKLRRLPAHLARLRVGCAVLGISLNYDDAGLESQIVRVAEANQMTDAVLRVTVTRGPGARGLAPPIPAKPTLLITAAPAPPYPEPARVIVAGVTRRNEHSPLSRIKTLNALDNILARNEAAGAGADDALLLNTQGRLAESTVANVFLLVDGGLITPPVEDGAMPGVARADVIRLAKAEERPVTQDLLARASEIFLSNALGIRPVIQVGDAAVGDGEPGLITQLLATRI
ncbi:MAG: aminotransferase class IV [Rhodospirillaceae bacterium]